MATVADLKNRLAEVKPRLSKVDNVVGIAVGGTSEEPHMVVMVSKDDGKTRETVARIADGLPYEIRETGKFKAMKR